MKKSLENFGIGIDIVEIERFRVKNYKKNKNFYEKIFAKSEIDYCLKFKDPYPHFAGKFGIKESVIKSVRDNITFQDISSSNSKNRPTVELTGKKSKKYPFGIGKNQKFSAEIIFSSINERRNFLRKSRVSLLPM